MADSSPDLTSLVERVRTRHASALAAIRNDTTRTEQWRRQQIAKVFLKMKAELDADVDLQVEAKVRTQRSLEAKVFGVSSLPGDVASLSISRRDAGDRVAGLKTQVDAIRLLDRADRSGDEVLARAIAERALENDWADVANAFVDTRPHLSTAVEQLWNSRPATAAENMAGHMIRGSLQPGELHGLSQHDIERLAESDVPPAPEAAPFLRTTGGSAYV